MKIKIIISISIFFSLFIGAYLLNSKEQKEFYVPEAKDDMVEIMSNESYQNGFKQYRVFKAREYVRVEGL